ncbi:hypothetical protein ACIA8G_17430 [Lentzea sp. NPDC051213]|uniref:hypothetical protein n=1 Tax=Lentzea sp. NPDC051213 TaxID=3364126 RepID=UPI0037B962B3
MGRSVATLLSALSLLAVVPAAAQAQAEIYLQVWPPSPQINTEVGVSLVGCRTPTVATSPGFVSPVQMEPVEYGIEGVVRVVDKAGGYTATAECAGKSYSVQFVVQEPGLTGWSLNALVEPGGQMHTKVFRFACDPEGPITSPGFAEPLRPLVTDPRWYEGTTTAITTPGTYTATLRCSGKPDPFTTLFTIKGTPPTSTSTPPPTKTTPPAAKPKPKAPIVKPKGAAQTGGGGTA